MRAAQLMKYSQNFELVVNDIPIPTVAPNEVLVKIHTAAVNPLEMLIGTGSVKLIQNYSLPLTMGNELAGEVVKIGAGVTKFHVGEAVYTRMPVTQIGAFAEYATVAETALALKPRNLDYRHSAAVPLTGLTAYQAFFDELQARPGDRVMIPGGSGSFGQMAVPIAASMGLKVSVSGNAQSRERIQQLGADEYFDYRQENYWEHLQPVDFVIDTVGKKELNHELQVLKADGKLLSLIMGPNRQFAVDHQYPTWKKWLFSLAGHQIDQRVHKFGSEYRFMFVSSNGDQLKKITKIVEDQQLQPAVNPTVFGIDDVNDALSLVKHGHPKGKVVISFDE